jgi:hypothetical protein
MTKIIGERLTMNSQRGKLNYKAIAQEFLIAILMVGIVFLVGNIMLGLD